MSTDPCPAWCTGSHGDQVEWHGVRYHESRPVVLDVSTGLGTVQCIAGMIQYPQDPDPAKRRVSAWSEVVASVRMARAPDVVAFADMLTGYAARLPEIADELVIAQNQDGRRCGDRPG